MKSKRVIAFLVDILIIILVSKLFKISFVAIDLQFIGAFGVVLCYVLFLCKDSYNGMSIGKRFVNVQVFDSKTMKVASPSKCVFRNCCFIFSFLEVAFMLFGSSGLRIGDYLFDTKVIKRNENCDKVNIRQFIKTVGIVIAIFLVVYIAIYTYATYRGIVELVFSL